MKGTAQIAIREDLHWLVQPRTKFKLSCGLVWTRSGESIDNMRGEKTFSDSLIFCHLEVKIICYISREKYQNWEYGKYTTPGNSHVLLCHLERATKIQIPYK